MDEERKRKHEAAQAARRAASVNVKQRGYIEPTRNATQPHAHTPLQVVFSAPPSLSRIDADGKPLFDSEGYAQYLEAKSARNAQGRYTIAEAAQVLAEAHGLEPAALIERRMLPAIDDGQLRAFDAADGGPLQGRKCNVYADEVTPAGIDAWLSAEGFAKHVRWPEPATAPEPPAPTPVAAPQKEVAEKAAPTGPKLSMTKAALIAQHKHEWPTIEGDIRGASENGLSKAAKAGARDWYEDAAMQWARSRNRLTVSTPAATLNNVMSKLPSRKHHLEG